MYRLRYTEQARKDLIAIKRYLARESGNVSVALKFTDKLREECRKLVELPGTMGRVRSELMEGLRSISYGNYIIIFRYSGELLEIITIIEGHRDIEELF